MIVRLYRRWPRQIIIALCALIALSCAIASVCTISLLPPKVAKRHLEVASASTRVSVDLARPLVTDALANDAEYESLYKRAVLVGALAASRPGTASIARRAGIDPSQLAARNAVTTGVQAAFTEPDSERRAAQIAMADRPYQLEIQPDQALPVLHLYAQAPTVAGAARIAESVAPAMQEYVDELARRDGLDAAKGLRLDQLGPARGGVVNGGAAVQTAGLTFMLAFAIACLLALAAARVARGRRSGGAVERAATPAAPLLRPSRSGSDAQQPPRPLLARAGDWPRTNRVLPWLIAAMIALVFLLPFNEIQLSASLPIDLKLDRLLLPFIVGAWILALAAGGRDAPLLRLTWIHAALAAVFTVACLSLVLEARTLNQALEFDHAVKKLTLLASYVTLFVVVASVVRRSEVRSFMSYTLLLAVFTALGTIVEFRTQYNVFYSLTDSILPGIFQVGGLDPSGIDEIGRRAVRGPGQVPLETVAMMTMALPIAIVRILQAERLSGRLLNGLATALLLAATVATFRKTAFLAPISVCLTLAYYRRRELIKLAPLGIVLVLVIQVLSPGALTGVAGQLRGDKLGVTTVSDRTADYDAIRPDVWSHLAFGRGYGSYEHTTYRLLDMELLRTLIEVGIVGLLAYLSLGIAVIAAARGPIRARGPDASPVALATAAAAVCFLVVSLLFDVMSFPHVPYTFLWMAALLAAMMAPEPAEGPEDLTEPWPATRAAGTILPVPAQRAKEPAWSS